MPVRLSGTVMPTGNQCCPFCGRGFWVTRDKDLHIQNDHHFAPQRLHT